MSEKNESRNAIRVRDLTKVYRLYKKNSDRLRDALGMSRGKRLYTELYALRNVSFDVAQGETVGIIGTNGSGKSTILKIITGVLSPTSGSVDVAGRISALLELGAGFNQEYTGVENVYLNGTMMGFTREEIDARLPEILAFADIGEFVHQPVKTYSSGMFVRLAFAVAINIDPEILIVDEALSVGDAFFQAKCYKKFNEFREQGKTILFVSHDLSSIAKYCDRVIVLNKGDMIAEGPPKEMVDLYKKLLVTHTDDAVGGVLMHEGGILEDAAMKLQHEEAEGITGILPKNPQTVEYGEFQAKIEKVTVLDEDGLVSAMIRKDTDFQIVMRVRFHEDVEAPIFAYTIKDIKGTEITGTNTLFEDAPVRSARKGDVYTVTFTQNMSLQGGEYLLSLGCTGYHAGDFRVFHRLYDLIGLTVVSTKNTVGFYDMHAHVDVEKTEEPHE